MILSVLVVVVVLLDVLRLRSRASKLRVLARGAGGHSLLTATGVHPEGSWESDADLVDLVPRDLPTVAALDLLGAVDPGKYRDDQWARGISASQAVLVREPYVEEVDPDDPTEFVAYVRRVKDHVRARVDIAVAPGLKAGPYDLGYRAATLRRFGKRPSLWIAGSVIGYATVVAALVTNWQWGLAALAAYSVHPVLVFAGTPLKPRDLWVPRVLRTPYLWFKTAGGKKSTAEKRQAQHLEQAAPWYEQNRDRNFHEAPRANCPSCGSNDLRRWVTATDLVQRKPGTFTMDRCVRCGHVWQNPRLTEEGLGFYYRDFYDGLGETSAEAVFSGKTEPYYGRARMVEPFTKPERWLDVGSGHAHFCLGAKEVLPQTRFDGLDQGAAIEDAARLGRIENSYRGSFKDFAGELKGRYDVISMHHYLEHVRDPWEELDIAADVLPDGGYLLIELPDPEWRLGRLFGQYWMPWFQPQHQHMMPIGNLQDALAERGLTTVATERAKAHLCNDFTLALLLWLGDKAPRTPAPWRPGRVRLRRTRSFLVWTLGIPAFFVALALDQTVNRFLAARTGNGNAYRLLAQKALVQQA
ncbi:methyltransferase domain-containing protein [Lentzea sp. BCCO 10_0798]|uniref:Methyltransferase domain-containing protein n=1 Tax=Lentzea kristufekii TaxID=3095430 RepID=A0ABU4TTE6_9PSEU|nr:methyltransferase domain-containing protein [Lentzea sp. BCCO 10_0798]MDX8051106.1 methyltransferase domain-containing protein [Lentzea sp. BCCO 10_0798]